MKKFLFLFLVMVVLSVTVAAQPMGYELKVSYDASDNGVLSELYVSEGDSVVAHVGFVYNTAKLELVNTGYDSIPDELPEGTTKEVFFNTVIESASELIIITPEHADVFDLLDKTNGLVMFGWYADLKIDSVYAGEKIASIRFRLKNGTKYSDITSADIVPVNTVHTKNVAGWSNGIMAADKSGKKYFYEPAEGADKIDVLVSFASYEASGTTEPEATKPEVTKPEVTKPEVTEPEVTEPEVVPETSEDTKNEVITADFGIITTVQSDRIRVRWEKLNNLAISEYRLTVSDSDGNVIRKIYGITEITKSFTVKDLAHDFEYVLSFAAVNSDGKEIFHNEKINVKIPVSKDSLPVIYDITYKSGIGTAYGMKNEQVLFGDYATKAPVIYAPEGYTFAGWSVDGVNIVKPDKLRIYSDMVFIAVFTKE